MINSNKIVQDIRAAVATWRLRVPTQAQSQTRLQNGSLPGWDYNVSGMSLGLWRQPPPPTKAENLLFALESKTTRGGTLMLPASCACTSSFCSCLAADTDTLSHNTHTLTQAQLICKFQRNTVPQNFNDHLEFSLGVSSSARLGFCLCCVLHATLLLPEVAARLFVVRSLVRSWCMFKLEPELEPALKMRRKLFETTQVDEPASSARMRRCSKGAAAAAAATSTAAGLC